MEELEIVIRDLVPKDVQRLAAKWEPLRALDADLKESLRQDLIDLLRGRRPKYTGFAAIPLREAQQDAVSYGTYIARSMPTKDAKKLLKAWDKRVKPAPTTRDQVIGHLLQLLNAQAGQSTVSKHVA